MYNRPYVAIQNVSHFLFARPALPWGLADKVAEVLMRLEVKQVGVTGSLHPSILVAAAHGDAKRQVNTFAYRSCWERAIAWNCVQEDSPGLSESAPWGNPCLPVAENQVHFWDGATPFFGSELLFIDLPFNHPCVALKLASFERRARLPRLMLGFMSDHDGPDDVLRWAREKGYEFEVFEDAICNLEKNQCVNYVLHIGAPPANWCERKLP